MVTFRVRQRPSIVGFHLRQCGHQPILRLGVLREGASIVVACLGEIFLRLDDLQHGIHPEFAPLLAQLEALVSKLDAASSRSRLIQSRTCGFVGVHDLPRDVILQSRVEQLLVPLRLHADA